MTGSKIPVQFTLGEQECRLDVRLAATQVTVGRAPFWSTASSNAHV